MTGRDMKRLPDGLARELVVSGCAFKRLPLGLESAVATGMNEGAAGTLASRFWRVKEQDARKQPAAIPATD